MLGKLLCKLGVHACIQAMNDNPSQYGTGWVMFMCTRYGCTYQGQWDF